MNEVSATETQHCHALKSGILAKGLGKRANILPPNSRVVQLHLIFENFASSLHETRNQLTVKIYDIRPPKSILELGLRHEEQISLLTKVQNGL